jgi:hypothetical protein
MAVQRFEEERQAKLRTDAMLIRVGFEHDADSIRKIPLRKLNKVRAGI